MKEPKVSVVVTTYNQEEYILQTIDSITMQKTNFPFELIIGVDHSPDNTIKLLKKYKNPNSHCDIIIVDRPKNLGPTKNSYELMKMCKGKYIAFLEGDDYWISNKKLQVQYDFLEKHIEYSGVAHDVNDIKNDGALIMKHSKHYHLSKKIVKYNRCERGHLDFHINSLMCHNIFFNKGVDFSVSYKASPITSDIIVPLFLTDINPIYVMDEVMGCYRFCENRYHDTFLEHTIEMLELAKKINGYPLKNHKIDYSIKIARTIIVCLFSAIIRPEKNAKNKYSELWKYINLKIVLFCIPQFFIIPSVYIFNYIKSKIYAK